MHWWTWVAIYLVGLFLLETVCRITELREKLNDKTDYKDQMSTLYCATVLYPLALALAIPVGLGIGVAFLGVLLFKEVYIKRFVEPIRTKIKKAKWDKENEAALKKQATKQRRITPVS